MAQICRHRGKILDEPSQEVDFPACLRHVDRELFHTALSNPLGKVGKLLFPQIADRRKNIVMTSGTERTDLGASSSSSQMVPSAQSGDDLGKKTITPQFVLAALPGTRGMFKHADDCTVVIISDTVRQKEALEAGVCKIIDLLGDSFVSHYVPEFEFRCW
jgi:hypothetical protein